MKKIIYSLLILLIAAMYTITAYASMHKCNSKSCGYVLKEFVLFDSDEEQRGVISLYNKLMSPITRKIIHYDEDFLILDLIELYNCIANGKSGMKLNDAEICLGFLDDLACDNGLFLPYESKQDFNNS